MNTRDKLKEIKWIPIWKQRKPSGILVPLSWFRVMWQRQILLRAWVIAVSLKLCAVVRSITLLFVVVGGVSSRWWKFYEVVYGAVKVEGWRGITSLLLCCCFLCQKSDETEQNVIVDGCKLGELFRSEYGVYVCNYVIGMVMKKFWMWFGYRVRLQRGELWARNGGKFGGRGWRFQCLWKRKKSGSRVRWLEEDKFPLFFNENVSFWKNRDKLCLRKKI